MATKNTSEKIHALTLAEINLTQLHAEELRQTKDERAAIYATAQKNGYTGESPIIDADERAAREQAKHFLNGSAPASLSLPPEMTRDKILYRKQRAHEIVLKILTDEGLVARAAEAVGWAEANGEKWRALCREIVLTAIRLEALEHSASTLLEQCGDIFAVRLPMANVIGGRAISEIPVSELKEIALAEGIVTNSEIKKAQNVE